MLGGKTNTLKQRSTIKTVFFFTRKQIEDFTLPRGDTKISLQVLKNIVKYFLNKRSEISYLQAVMQCAIYYINTNEIPSHFTVIVFCRERRDLISSHSKGHISRVKVTCYHSMEICLPFHWRRAHHVTCK